VLVLAQGLVQVSFLLQVRKADLALVSTKELNNLMRSMAGVLNRTIGNAYSVKTRVIIDGVMISTST